MEGNRCIICGKQIDDEELYCSDCKLDIEIKEFERQLEM